MDCPKCGKPFEKVIPGLVYLEDNSRLWLPWYAHDYSKNTCTLRVLFECFKPLLEFCGGISVIDWTGAYTLCLKYGYDASFENYSG